MGKLRIRPPAHTYLPSVRAEFRTRYSRYDWAQRYATIFGSEGRGNSILRNEEHAMRYFFVSTAKLNSSDFRNRKIIHKRAKYTSTSIPAISGTNALYSFTSTLGRIVQFCEYLGEPSGETGNPSKTTRQIVSTFPASYTGSGWEARRAGIRPIYMRRRKTAPTDCENITKWEHVACLEGVKQFFSTMANLAYLF